MIENTTIYHSLTDDEKRKIKEAETHMREFLERHDSINQSEFYRMRGEIPHWCFYEVLQYLEDNDEIQREPIYEIKDYKIMCKKGQK